MAMLLISSRGIMLSGEDFRSASCVVVAVAVLDGCHLTGRALSGVEVSKMHSHISR